MSHISRRGLLKGAAAAAGALAGTRLAGRGFEGDARAQAAGETSHLVHIVLPGGINAIFTGCAQELNGKFGVNPVAIGNGVTTDRGILDTLPDFAKQHWAAIGLRHGNTSHLVNGAERSILFDGQNSYLNQLAVAMGGDSAIKSVHFGDRMPYGPQPGFQGTSLQRITDLGAAIKALGAGGADPNAPNRELAGVSLDSAANMSKPHVAAHPGALTSMTDSYTAGVAALQKPPPPPVTFDDIKTAYSIPGTAVNSFAAQMAGAEVMIRAAGTNVINMNDRGFVLWDFHQLDGGSRSRNGEFSRSKFPRGGATSVLGSLKTFLNRMLNVPGRNVVVVLSGDFVRTPSGDHGDGTVTAVWGKYIKQGKSFPCDANARFSPQTPNVKAFWSAMADALKVQKNPFGNNPHAALTKPA